MWRVERNEDVAVSVVGYMLKRFHPVFRVRVSAVLSIIEVSYMHYMQEDMMSLHNDTQGKRHTQKDFLRPACACRFLQLHRPWSGRY